MVEEISNEEEKEEREKYPVHEIILEVPEEKRVHYDILDP